MTERVTITLWPTRTNAALRRLVLARDGYRCVRCGETKNLAARYIDPKGEDVASNLETRCDSC